MSLVELKVELALADIALARRSGAWPAIGARVAISANYDMWRADVWPGGAAGLNQIVGRGDTPETAIADLNAKIAEAATGAIVNAAAM